MKRTASNIRGSFSSWYRTSRMNERIICVNECEVSYRAHLNSCCQNMKTALETKHEYKNTREVLHLNFMSCVTSIRRVFCARILFWKSVFHYKAWQPIWIQLDMKKDRRYIHVTCAIWWKNYIHIHAFHVGLERIFGDFDAWPATYLTHFKWTFDVKKRKETGRLLFKHFQRTGIQPQKSCPLLSCISYGSRGHDFCDPVYMTNSTVPTTYSRWS